MVEQRVQQLLDVLAIGAGQHQVQEGLVAEKLFVVSSNPIRNIVVVDAEVVRNHLWEKFNKKKNFENPPLTFKR